MDDIKFGKTAQDARFRLSHARLGSLQYGATIEYMVELEAGLTRWLANVSHELNVARKAKIEADRAAHPDDRDGNYDVLGHYICPNSEAGVDCDCHYCACLRNRAETPELR